MKSLAALCLSFGLALAACDGGSGESSSPTNPSVAEINCKSRNAQNQIGNTTINNVNVDCGDATAEPFVFEPGAEAPEAEE